MIKGKNYEIVNMYGIQYKIVNSHTGHFHCVISKYDIAVDKIYDETEFSYYILSKDLDGEYFAQPIDSNILIEKLMSGWIGMTIDLFKQEELK